MSFNDNIIEEIKSRCNIVDVIGQVVSLKKAGSNYKGVCPFHNEKTPSFVVSETKQIFTCFGCGATGDVFEFVKRYYNLDFTEALMKLGKEYGVEVNSNDYGSSEEKEKLYEINKMAARFFFENIKKKDNAGFRYMNERGITPETIKKFGIGYAEDSWDSLLNYMTSEGVDKDIMVNLGLLSVSNGKYYDKFRNRVIFPIINTRGKIIGFGGRIIGDGMPKYLNSPESSVFLKKNNLYGLNLSRQEISAKDCAILVEGYMDVVSLYQNGVKNVAASLGTALTENQAKMLKRYSSNVVLSYDSDNAGVAAALRGIDILHEQKCKARVLHVTEGKDPDEFIKKKGKSAFEALVKNAPGFADYKISVIKGRYNLEKTEDRLEFVRDVVLMLQKLTPAERDIYIKKIADEAGISEGAIRHEFNDVKTETHEYRKNVTSEEEKNISGLEKNLIRLSLNDEEYLKIIMPESKNTFTSGPGNRIWNSISAVFKETGEADLNKIFDSLDENDSEILNYILDNIKFGGNDEDVLVECMVSIEIKRLEKRAEEISNIIGIADESDNREVINDLMMELKDIQITIQKMKERGLQ